MGSEKLRIFDLHCDTLYRMAMLDGVSCLISGDEGKEQLSIIKKADPHILFEQMRAFDWCQCIAIFIPDRLAPEETWRYYQQARALFDEVLVENNDHLVQVYASQEITKAFFQGKSAAILTIEGASFLRDSLEHVEEIVHDGARIITLTWNAQNAIAGGVSSHEGFSSFGRQVVKALEEQQIIIDASHLSDESFSDLQSIATRPFIASHSNSRTVCDHPRNLTDEQFLCIKERGGVVGLNFCNGFLITDKRDPTPEDVLRHVEHWLNLGGEETIALGSDYDGADIPSWLMPGDKLPVLHEHVRKAFGKRISEKLFSENTHFFLKQNLRDAP